MSHAPYDAATHPVPAPPLDQSIIDMIDNSPLSAILHTPVGEILGKLGITLPPMPPPVPPIPELPALPPMPSVDVDQLFKPLTEAYSGFGSGDLGSSGIDPSTIFNSLSQLLTSSISASGGALKMVDQLWSGLGAQANTTKTSTAQTEGGAVGTKSANISANTQSAAAIVAAGNAKMVELITRTAALVSAEMSMIWNPGGAAMIMATMTEAITEAQVIIATTKAALTPETIAQTINGQQIPITGAPAGLSPFGVASNLLQTLGQPVSTLASTGSSVIGTVTKQLASGSNKLSDKGAHKGSLPGGLGPLGAGGAPGDHKGDHKPGAGKGGGAGGGAGKGGGGGGGGLGGIATPLSARPAVANLPTNPTGSSAPLSETSSGTSTSGTSSTAGRSATTSGGGMMPMGAGAAGGMGGMRGAGSDDGHGSPDYLVTAEHGTAIVGDMPGAAPAVIGDEPTNDDEARRPQLPEAHLRL